ncbi:MAG: hypothetical protein ACK4GK_14705 [Ferrovibrio sp.]
MALPLDPTVPLAGIALILLLVWLTGGLRSARLADASEAAALLGAAETGFVAAEIAVSSTRDCAIAHDGHGRLAMVFTSGAKLAARKLQRDDIATVTLTPQDDGSALLAIRTRAFTHSDFALRLDQGAAEDWRRRVTEMPA